ncbi:MAG TPA: sucrase ferredoxin [Actinomycetota bacterium]|nr:sucrase ferredoxin [Actinomycetota bacterium]
MLGTASRIRSWLLVEQPGAWGPNAVTESGLDRRLATELKARAGGRVRVLLTRRSDEETPARRRCFLVHSGAAHPWVRSWDVDDARELLRIDFGALAAGEPLDVGRAQHSSLYLVCTNGSRDPCCDTRGAPTAAALRALRPDHSWECSHVGGDRFAANLVCLPHGIYFGRVEPEDLARILSLYENGVIDLAHYRGRSCYEPVVQAGESFVRARTGLARIDDLVPEERRDRGPTSTTLTFRDRFGGRHDAVVGVRRAAPRPLTCTSSAPGAPREFFEAEEPVP